MSCWPFLYIFKSSFYFSIIRFKIRDKNAKNNYTNQHERYITLIRSKLIISTIRLICKSGFSDHFAFQSFSLSSFQDNRQKPKTWYNLSIKGSNSYRKSSDCFDVYGWLVELTIWILFRFPLNITVIRIRDKTYILSII